jgi:hypothetical protein
MTKMGTPIRQAGLLQILALMAAASSHVQADYTAALTKERVCKSSLALQFFRVSLDKVGTLFRKDAAGAEVVLWQAKLVNQPAGVLVSDAGSQVVTLDTYGYRGYEHALVVYGEGGRVLADYALEDLLTAEEIRDKVPTTSPNRHWVACGDFSFEGSQLIARLRWHRIVSEPFEEGPRIYWKELGGGKLIRVDLKTGRIIQNVVIPPDIPG